MELISSRYSVVDGFLIASQQNGTKVIIDHETCCLSLNKAEKDLISAKKLRDLSRYRKSKSKLVACESQLLFEIVTAAPQVFIQNSNYTREANKGNNTKYTQSLLVIPAFFFSDVKKYFFFSQGSKRLQFQTGDTPTTPLVEERKDLFTNLELKKPKFSIHDLDALRCYKIDQDLYTQECFSLLSFFQTKTKLSSQDVLTLETALPIFDKNLKNSDLDHCIMNMITDTVAPLHFVLVNIGIFSFGHSPFLGKLSGAPLRSRIGRSYNLEVKSRYLGKLFQSDMQSYEMDGLICLLLQILAFRTDEYSDPSQILEVREIEDFCNRLAALIIWIGYAVFAESADSVISSANCKHNSSLKSLIRVYQKVKAQCDT